MDEMVSGSFLFYRKVHPVSCYIRCVYPAVFIEMSG